MAENRTIRRLEKRFYERNPSAKKRNTELSRQWFWKNATKLGKIKTSIFMREKNRQKEKPIIGRLYMFRYLAKHRDDKKKLPYWDAFPLVFFWDAYKKDGKAYLIGLNMHHLPPKQRLILFKELLKIRNEKRFRKETKLKMSWELLKAFSNHNLVQPTVKVYLRKNILSKLIEVPADEWEIVMFMNTVRMVNVSAKEAWKRNLQKSKK